MLRKPLTDKQLIYIFNKVIVPKIEYQAQSSILNKNECSKLMSAFRICFKKKLHISSKTTNIITQCKNIYDIIDLFDLQQRVQINNLMIQLNDKSILGKITDIKLKQLQLQLWLPISPLIRKDAPFKKIKHNIIASTLSLIEDSPFTFAPSDKSKIQGGISPLIDIFGQTYFQYIKLLKKHNFMFLDQLISHDNTHFLNRRDLAIRYENYRNSGKKDPKWFQKLKQIILEDATISCKLKSSFILSSTNYIPLKIKPPNMNNNSKEWVAIWNNKIQDIILGKIHKKDLFNNKILVEHWILNSHNTSTLTTITKCQGCPCHIPIKKYEHTITFLCNDWYNYKNASTFKAKKVNRATDLYEVIESIFEIKAKSKKGFLNNSFPSNIVNCSITPKALPINIKLINTYIKNNICKSKLIESSELYKNSRELVFYTDGSLKDLGTPNTKMGLGWSQINDNYEKSTFSASITNLPSSTHAEIAAILTALLVSPNNCHVTIFSDSENTIQAFCKIMSKNEHITFRKLIKEKNYLMWFLIKDIIEQLNLKVYLKKVKAHSNNLRNEEADKLAKTGLKSEPLNINYENIPFLNYQPTFDNIRIETSLRHFIKRCTEAKNFEIWTKKNINKKYNVSKELNINWPFTWFRTDLTAAKNTKQTNIETAQDLTNTNLKQRVTSANVEQLTHRIGLIHQGIGIIRQQQTTDIDTAQKNAQEVIEAFRDNQDIKDNR
ncbi:2015_t:CDS:2 [Entrophospora sp. SA101]|nr:2015_t:CDS:2 [Entrophospora sp. SA101]